MADKKFIVIEGVINGGDAINLPRPLTVKNIQQVWTVLNPKQVKVIGLVHWHSAFLEDRMHDWDFTREGKIRFYGHSGAKGDVHTLAIVYE